MSPKPTAPKKKAPMATAEMPTNAAAVATPVTPFDGLTEGRHVYFEGPNGHYAAIVAKVVDKEKGVAILTAFDHDGVPFFPGACAYDEGTLETGWTMGRWRWMFSGQGPHMLQPGAEKPQYNA